MIRDDERYWANMVLGVIENLERPMLMYEDEKMIVRKALKAYLEANDSDSEKPNNSTCSKMEQVEDKPQADGILFKGDLKEGDYKLIKTTDGWVLEGKDIVYCGWERGE